MNNKLTRVEEAWANELDNVVAEMVAMYKVVDVDRVEAVFEKNCSRCRLNKDCKNCASYNRFVAILDRV